MLRSTSVASRASATGFRRVVFCALQVEVVARRSGEADGPAAQLKADIPAIVRAIARQLRDKSVKAKSGVFQLLKELVTAQPNAVAAEMEQLVPGIAAALEVGVRGSCEFVIESW